MSSNGIHDDPHFDSEKDRGFDGEADSDPASEFDADSPIPAPSSDSASLESSVDGGEVRRASRWLFASLAVLCAAVGYSYYRSSGIFPPLRTSPASSPSFSPKDPHRSEKFGTLAPPPLGSYHPSLPADASRRSAILEATRHSWSAYERYAWGDDECHPLSKGGSNLTRAGGVGYQIVDALDTLLVMELDEEYKRGAEWVRKSLDFDKDAEFSTFETTIRLLGGLLSAHHLTSIHSDPSISADAPMYLDKSVDLADRLLAAYDTPSGLPLTNVNLAQRVGVPDMGINGFVSIAESASVQLEMKYLSHLTGDSIYWRTAEKAMKVIRSQNPFDGITPIFMNPRTGQFVPSEIRLGSRGDSYYEYLLKQWLQTNRQEPVYKDMYDQAMSGIKSHLVSKTKKSGVLFTQELIPARDPENGQQTWQISPKQDHLVCFLGGSLILGVTEGQSSSRWSALEGREVEDILVGDGIIESCLKTYETPTGLGPEIAMFRMWSEPLAEVQDWYIKPSTPGKALIDARNILRPETVESLFLAYRATGDAKYREAGWRIFEAFQTHCRVPEGGYVGVEDVQRVPPKQLDRMETFWIGETLKYLYLLFDDSSHIPLDRYVFNTEAHILPVFTPAQLTDFSTS